MRGRWLGKGKKVARKGEGYEVSMDKGVRVYGN